MDDAGAVVVGLDVVVDVVVVALSTEQVFHCPTAGSPKVALLQAAELVNALVTYEVAVPYRTLWVPLNVQVPFSCAHVVQVELVGVGVGVGVVVGVVVVVVEEVVLLYQQPFHCPTAGSPKVALLQAAGPVSVLVKYEVVVPYFTLRVPLKLHVPFSCAHKVQDEDEPFLARASAVGSSVLADAASVSLESLALADALLTELVSLVLPLPPPQAANTAAVRTDRLTDRKREEY